MGASNHYCVILAGGRGSRFWPLSREDKPKQFVDIMGFGRTMIQLTYDRVKEIFDQDKIFVVTLDVYTHYIEEQLPDIPKTQILTEPIRRNTAASVLYAAYKIKSICLDAKVMVTPSDHIVNGDDIYRDQIVQGLELIENKDEIITLGIKPTKPLSAYGYIQVDGRVESKNGVFEVKTFTEKPPEEMAKAFIETGEFFWNSGVFIWNSGLIIDLFKRFQPEISSVFESGLHHLNTESEFSYMRKVYSEIKSISIDYAILEKANSIKLVEARFQWTDLGIWSSLYDIKESDDNDNLLFNKNVYLSDCSDSIIRLPAGKRAVIEGLDGYIVADQGDTILICKKESSDKIRSFVEEVEISN